MFLSALCNLAGTSGLSPFFAYQHDTAVGLSACFCRYDYRGAEWQIRAASVACRRCLGFYGMYVLGCLFAPDEIGIGRLWRSFYYPQSILLWGTYHLALLSYHPWLAGMGCVYEASGGGESPVPGVFGIHDMFPYLELVYL